MCAQGTGARFGHVMACVKIISGITYFGHPLSILTFLLPTFGFVFVSLIQNLASGDHQKRLRVKATATVWPAIWDPVAPGNQTWQLLFAPINGYLNWTIINGGLNNLQKPMNISSQK